jgi:hypothetical protein
MTIYRKKKTFDSWHFCTNCSRWPTYDYDQKEVPAGQRPSGGELCDECLGKEKNGTCTKQ